MHKFTVRDLGPLAWAIVLLCVALPVMALPPIMYPDPPGDGGSGGGGSSCTNDFGAGCPHTFKLASTLQVWCGADRGWVWIDSQSCSYDVRYNTACCTYQNEECTYYDSRGVMQRVEETLAKQEPCP